MALAVSSLALAGLLNTDAYSAAAQAEATGFDALSQRVSTGGTLLCSNDVATPAGLVLDPTKSVTR